MRAMKIAALVASSALGLALLAGAARADDQGFARDGFYLGVGETYAHNLINSALDGVLANNFHVDNTFGLNARAGYRATSWFAAELEYEWVARFEAKLRDRTLADIEGHSLTANLKFVAPLGRFQPFLLLGGGGSIFSFDRQNLPEISVQHSSWTGRVGLGVDMYLTRNVLIDLGADTVFTTANISATGLKQGDGLYYFALRMGLQYRF